MTMTVKPMDASISPAAISPKSVSKVLIVTSDEYAKAGGIEVLHLNPRPLRIRVEQLWQKAKDM
jgi:hypothetical protein